MKRLLFAAFLAIAAILLTTTAAASQEITSTRAIALQKQGSAQNLASNLALAVPEIKAGDVKSLALKISANDQPVESEAQSDPRQKSCPRSSEEGIDNDQSAPMALQPDQARQQVHSESWHGELDKSYSLACEISVDTNLHLRSEGNPFSYNQWVTLGFHIPF